MCAIMDIGDDAHEPDYFKIKRTLNHFTFRNHLERMVNPLQR